MRRPENPGVGGSQIERLAYEEVMFAPIFELGFVSSSTFVTSIG